MENIYKDSNMVKLLAAEAMGKRVDSALSAEADEQIKAQASDPNPMNRYLMAQIMAFGVSELKAQETNFLANVADTKKTSIGQKAAFRISLSDVKAYIQAKGATTARSIIANKQVLLDTVEVSARPVMNLIEVASGDVKMSDLIREAKDRMVAAEYTLIQKVLNDGVKNWASPFYGTGSGLVKATIDPMINFWKRTGRVAILGDIEMLGKFSELTGFKASASATQFSDAIVDEHNQNGYLGVYNGAQLIAMTNPYADEAATTPVFDVDKAYILPAAAASDMRPLKVVHEGDVQSTDVVNIDNGCYEVCLREFVGAGMAYGKRPYMSVYSAT